MKLSKHAKIRIRQRTDLNHVERRNLFKMALTNGLSIRQIKNAKIRTYLMKKIQYNCRIKLYKGYVFIYSRNSKQLYTMYKLPEGLGDEK